MTGILCGLALLFLSGGLAFAAAGQWWDGIALLAAGAVIALVAVATAIVHVVDDLWQRLGGDT